MGPGLLGRRTPNPLLPSWDHGSQLSVPRAAGELAVRPSASQGSWGHRRAELAAALHDLELPPARGHGASLGLPDLGAGGAGAGVGGVEAQRGACSELPAWGCRVLAAAPSVPGARGPAVAWSLGLATLTLGRPVLTQPVHAAAVLSVLSVLQEAGRCSPSRSLGTARPARRVGLWPRRPDSRPWLLWRTAAGLPLSGGPRFPPPHLLVQCPGSLARAVWSPPQSACHLPARVFGERGGQDTQHLYSGA